MEQTMKEIRTKNPLGYQPIGRLLMKFAIPSVISMLVNAVYNIVDQIFIGQGVGYHRMRLQRLHFLLLRLYWR
ncbi:MAG: hypothetical protein ACLTJG_02645 [[Clostridium] innocuum]